MRKRLLTEGEIIRIEWEGGGEYELAAGHLTVDEAASALRDFMGDDSLRVKSLHHHWARCQPDPEQWYRFLVEEYHTQQRGCFKVTAIYYE